MINVVEPNLPPIDEFIEYIGGIWSRKQLTNSGPLHIELEGKLAQFLNVKNVCLFSNATIALMAAVKVLGVQKSVITTPFTFAATLNAITWNNLKPIFCDIDLENFGILQSELEKKINSETGAVLPVTCFGQPGELVNIEKYCKNKKVKLIIDSAHSFDVWLDNRNILDFGDISIVSFHATKVFNTFEGGAIVFNDTSLKKKIESIRNFGLVNQVLVDGQGLNGKMSEISAAMGLAQIPHIASFKERRKKLYFEYIHNLSDVKEIQLIKLPENLHWNYSYFPIVLKNEHLRNCLIEKLSERGIVARKYFYPLVNEAYEDAQRNTPNAYSISRRILCLPFHSGINSSTAIKISNIVQDVVTSDYNTHL